LSRRGGGADPCPAIHRAVPALDRTGPNHFHFASILRSWLNAVEDSTLAKPPLKRSVLRSVADLQAAINRFLDNCNTAAKPFIWTGDPDKIIAAVRCGYQMLDSIH